MVRDMTSHYEPPYTITPVILGLVARISEAVGHLTALAESAGALRLRRINRVRTSKDHWPLRVTP